MIDKKIEEAARRNADRYRNYPTLSDEDRDKVTERCTMLGTQEVLKMFVKCATKYTIWLI